jgi:UDP-GlcNAc:undecaprenyl-phosphate GlcNAc-1-phosphate transferase
MSMSVVTPLLAGASFACCAALLPLVRALADRHGWHDLPDHRKLHTGKITYLGGVAVFGAVVLTVVGAGVIAGSPSWRIWPLLGGALVLHILGIADDARSLPAFPRLLIHLVVSSLVAASGHMIHSLALPGLPPLRLGAAAYPVTVLWVAGVINAVNWSDGMDGYAGGIAAVAAAAFCVLGVFAGDLLTVIWAAALVGALLAFLRLNYPPARVFLGDNGSTVVGYLLAVLPLLGTPPEVVGRRIPAMAFVLLLPLLDLVAAILRRALNGQSPGRPDRGHIHHRLQGLGLAPGRLLVPVYVICAYISTRATQRSRDSLQLLPPPLPPRNSLEVDCRAGRV